MSTVDYRFLISGHSFIVCDQDFGITEKTKRKPQFVSVQSDWMNINSKASQKFMAIQITTSNLISLEPMNNTIKDPVKRIHKMQWFHFEKTLPYLLPQSNS
jgi:hypothetical protein